MSFVIKYAGALVHKVGIVEQVLSSVEAKRRGLIKSGRSGKVLAVRCCETGDLYHKQKSVCKPAKEEVEVGQVEGAASDGGRVEATRSPELVT